MKDDYGQIGELRGEIAALRTKIVELTASEEERKR